jgi:hypothetical protein
LDFNLKSNPHYFRKPRDISNNHIEKLNSVYDKYKNKILIKKDIRDNLQLGDYGNNENHNKNNDNDKDSEFNNNNNKNNLEKFNYKEKEGKLKFI